MPYSIDIYPTPSTVNRSLTGQVAVAVDVLRAGTTIVTALENGAEAVAPFLDIATAQGAAESHANAILGGERKGRLIEGFDLSNSPADYRKENIAEKRVFFTTTNGTKAIEASRTSDITAIGSFVNLTALCQFLKSCERSISIVCAGTNGEPSLEDHLFAGAVCNWFTETQPIRMNTMARAVQTLWKTAQRQMDQGVSLFEILCRSQGGKNLIELEFTADIQLAAELDRYHVVPLFDVKSGLIRTDVDLNGWPR